MKIDDIKFDCRHFRGDVPCLPNKLRNRECDTCTEYEPVKTRILIIKLGAMGDVIRTTPLLHRFRKEYPGCHITWVTHTPEVVPASSVERILTFEFKHIYALQHQHFDVAVNLDKDPEACALLQDIASDKKFGFILKKGHIAAATPEAENKLLTGAFDSLSQKNTRNYLEEIFEICGFDFRGERYILDRPKEPLSVWDELHEKSGGRKIIGLNTGCGKRWLTRLWPQEYWLELIKCLQSGGYFTLLLGGADEDKQNRYYAEKSGAWYPGTFTLKEFISLSAECHVIVTVVSMMMHIAIGLSVPLILFNNIFNPHEFELYGNGIILQPGSGCDCYFGNSCTRERHCMYDLPVNTVFTAIKTFADKKH